MKKVALVTLLCLTAGMASGQMKLVNSAFGDAKQEPPKIDDARNKIGQTLTNEESAKNAKTWYVAGFIENKAFETERNLQFFSKTPDEKKMYPALIASYSYFLKSAELDVLPDEKGKVKPKYLKDIKKTLKTNHNDYINGGAYYYDQKDYKKAYDFFQTHVDIPNLDFMKDQGIAKDSNYVTIMYYAAIAAVQTKDSDLAIKALSAAKNMGFNENEIYQYLYAEYDQLKDTVNMINLLKEGADRFQKEPYYVANLINIYIRQDNLDAAIAYLDKGIEADPKNAPFWNVKGQLYENQKNDQKAIECFDKAIEIDPAFAEAYGNKGRVVFNQAVRLNDEVNEEKDNKIYNKRKTEEVIPAFKKALPFYIKANELQPTSRDFLVALRAIYYNLNQGKELSEIEAKLESL